jgi:hypothetical protein
MAERVVRQIQETVAQQTLSEASGEVQVLATAHLAAVAIQAAVATEEHLAAVAAVRITQEPIKPIPPERIQVMDMSPSHHLAHQLLHLHHVQ